MNEELSIRETQSVSLEILHDIAEICEQNGLRYCLIYGTLIGAIRHNGYIPWDDDVDIMMPRPDYEKLMIILKKNMNRYPFYEVFNHDNNNFYPYMITRISDKRYEIVMDNEKPYGMGVFIDIYPYDGMGETHECALKYGMRGDRLSSFCYQSTRKHYRVENTTSIAKKIMKFPVYCIAKMIGKDFFQNKLQKEAAEYDYDTSKYVGCFVWLSGGDKDIFLKKWFDETIMHKFEKYEFRIPKAYDEILTKIYGNYMMLPPKEKRIGHHYYKVYRK